MHEISLLSCHHATASWWLITTTPIRWKDGDGNFLPLRSADLSTRPVCAMDALIYQLKIDSTFFGYRRAAPSQQVVPR